MFIKNKIGKIKSTCVILIYILIYIFIYIFGAAAVGVGFLHVTQRKTGDRKVAGADGLSVLRGRQVY